MSFLSVQNLANKIAQQHFGNNKDWNAQRERLSQFYSDVMEQIRTIISNLGGDIITLRELKGNKDVRKHLALVYSKIIELSKNIDNKYPYEGVENLSQWVENRNNKILLENLDFLIQHELKKAVEFYPSKGLISPYSNSIKKLMELAPYWQAYIFDHPLLLDPRKVSVKSPEEYRKFLQEMLNYKEKKLNPNAETSLNIPIDHNAETVVPDKD